MSTTTFRNPAYNPRRADVVERTALTHDDTAHLVVVSRAPYLRDLLVLGFSDDYDVALDVARREVPLLPGETIEVRTWRHDAPVYASGKPVNVEARLDVINGTYALLCWLTGTPAHVPPARPAFA